MKRKRHKLWRQLRKLKAKGRKIKKVRTMMTKLKRRQEIHQRIVNTKKNLISQRMVDLKRHSKLRFKDLSSLVQLNLMALIKLRNNHHLISKLSEIRSLPNWRNLSTKLKMFASTVTKLKSRIDNSKEDPPS